MTSRRLILSSVLALLGGLYSCQLVPQVHGQGFPPDGCSFELQIDGECCFCFVGTRMVDRGVNKTNHCCDCDPGKFNDDAADRRGMFTRATSCKECAIGRFQPNAGASECKTCTKGKVSDAGATSCTACPAGTYQNEPLKSQCKECEPGRAESSTGSTECDMCEEGFYSNEGWANCQRCPAGYFTDQKEQSSCSACEIGKFANRAGSTSCLKCIPGRYQGSTGGSGCPRCPAGFYQPQEGQDSCIEAEKGHYANPGSRRQILCPRGRYASVPGSPNWRCEGPTAAGKYSTERGQTSKTGGKNCPAGRYGRPGDTHSECTDLCPAGHICPPGTGVGDWENCGDFTVHCPRGSSEPREVPEGHYATGEVPNQVHAPLCPLGSYCQQSERDDCPAGRYGDERGLTSEQCTDVCDDGYRCPPGSISPREQVCGVPDSGNPLYYCQEGFRYECTDGYTVPDHQSKKTRTGCRECPHDSRCYGGRRLSKIVWNDAFCKHHNTRDTMYVKEVKGDDAPQEIGEKLSTEIRIPHNKAAYSIRSIVQDGRTLDGGRCEADVTDNSPVVMKTIPDDEYTGTFDEIPQFNAMMMVENGSTLRFADCGRYNVHVQLTVIESGVEETPNISAEVTEVCSFEMVVEFVNSDPKKVDGDIDKAENFDVFRISSWNDPVGEPLAPKFDDPDGQELTFTLSQRDREGNTIDQTDVFSVGACTGQLQVNKPALLRDNEQESYTLYILVSDNFPDDPGELVQEVHINVVQPNRPPRLAEDLPVLSIVERADPGTRVVTLEDPQAENITSIVHPAFVTDPDGDEVFTKLVPCTRQNYCNAFRLTSDGNLTVRDPEYLSSENPATMARFVRVEYTDRAADPIQAVLDLRIQLLRSAPTVTSSDFMFKETLAKDEEIGQLEAEDNHGTKFEFSRVGEPQNNLGMDDNRIDVSPDGKIFVSEGSFDSILCEDSFCRNCTEHDLWIDITVTAQVVDRTDTMPGPTVSEPTRVRLSIELVNEAPRFIIDETLTVEENIGGQHVISDLSSFACDRDGNSMFFDLSVDSDSDQVASQFSLSSSGLLVIEQAVDYEDVQTVYLPVTVEDTGSPSAESQLNVTVHVVDVPEAPVLDHSENTFEAPEHTTAEAGSLGQIRLTDPDVLSGTNAKYASAPSDYHFEQKNLEGKLSLSGDGKVSISPGYVPNYEEIYDSQTEEAVLYLEFTARDIVHNISTEFTIGVTITNVPEPPYFTPPRQNFTVNLFSNSGDTLGNVDTTTEDIGDPVDVSLVEAPKNIFNSKSAPFSITLRDSGRLLITPGSEVNLVEADIGSWYSFVVQAVDSFDLSVNGTHFIEVTNKPIPPVWTNPSEFNRGETLKLSLPENSGGLFESFNPQCIDPNRRDVQYQLISVEPYIYDAIFRFNRQTGQLTVDDPHLLDYESLKNSGNDVAKFEIICIDSFSKQANTTGNLDIEISNVAEAPKFVMGNQDVSVSIKEDAPMGSLVEEVIAFDEDFGNANELAFDIVEVSGNGGNPFSLTQPVYVEDGRTAKVNLTVSSELNFFRESSYDLVLKVTDPQGQEDSLPINVAVEFVNTAPKFTKASYDISAPESITSEDVIADMADFPFNDRNLTDQYTFSVISADSMNLFQFISNELRLKEGLNLNYELRLHHHLTIRVNDSGGLYDEANVKLEVQNVNDISIESVRFSPHAPMGDSEVTILGHDLGPVWRSASVKARITSPGDHMILESTCPREEVGQKWNNTMVMCTVPPGVGSSLRWKLIIDEDSRTAPFTTYFRSPTPNQIEEWPDPAFTSGGQKFVLKGQNFGPLKIPTKQGKEIPNPVAVEYWSESSSKVGMLSGRDCEIFSNDEEIHCWTAEGAGAMLKFRVLSASLEPRWQQTSVPLQSDGIHYTAPSVDAIWPLSEELPTTGLADVLLVEGNNFGPSNDLISASLKNQWIEWKPECKRRNHTFLLCNLPEGLGEEFDLQVTVAEQVSPLSPKSESISYDKPVLDGVLDVVGRPPRDLNTRGNELVFLHGHNFGPGVGDEGEVGISVQYGETLEYTAANCRVANAHTLMECITVPGVGKNHSWLAHMGNQTSNRVLGASNYHPPIVATYTRANSSELGINDLETPGDEIITIRGRYFGPPGQPVDKVTYGEGNFTFKAHSCNVRSHTEMDCATAPGAGAGHFWTVQVGGQSSEISTTSYEEPIIKSFDGVNGSDPQHLSTLGGEWIDVVGENFGPPDASGRFLQSVTFGSDGTDKEAIDCRVLAHERIRCKTPPGLGQKHSWIVIVAEQKSDFSFATTSYSPPEIASIDPQHGPTGFDKTDGTMPTLVVRGKHLGANLVENTPIRLLMDTHGHLKRLKEEGAVANDENLLQRVLAAQQSDPSSWLANVDSLGFPPDELQTWLDSVSSIDISSNDIQYVGTSPSIEQRIKIQQPSGFGIDRGVFLKVGGTYSQPLQFDYDPPTIQAISPSIVDGDKVKLTIFGRNFCGGSSCGDTSCCGRLFVDDFALPIDVPEDQYFHDEIQKVLSIGRLGRTQRGFPRGTVQIKVLDQPIRTSKKNFREPLPEIPSQAGRVRLNNFVTRGGEQFRLFDIKEIRPIHMNNPDQVSVTIGGKECTELEVTSAVVNNNTGASFGNISCLTPPHMGKDLLVSVSVQGKEVPRSDVNVHYRGPDICFVAINSSSASDDFGELLFKDRSCDDWLEPSNTRMLKSNSPLVPEVPIPDDNVGDGISTHGGTVTVRGFNFGTADFDLNAEIRFPEILQTTTPSYHDHERMDFEIPPGSGGSENTVREAQLAIGDYTTSFSYRYIPPSIDTISPQELPTNASGQRFFIFGSNFGPPSGMLADGYPYSPNITVLFQMSAFEDPRECHVVSSNHSFIECEPPEGQGDEVVVTVDVDGQEASTELLRYKPAEVDSMSPLSGPTDGVVNEEPVAVTLLGQNFGAKGKVQFDGEVFDPVYYSHSKVVFNLPAGYGEDLEVILVPAGWSDSGEGSSQPILFSFDPPVVYSVSRLDGKSVKDCTPFERCTSRNNKTSCFLEYPDCFPTSGEVTIALNGSNFGPSGNEGPDVELIIEGHEENIEEATTSDDPHHKRIFMLPEGVGADLLAQIVVSGRVSDVNESATLSYDPPRINRIMPNSPDATGETIEFRGANFGTEESGDLKVKLGNQTCKNAFIRNAHTSIVCDMPKTTVGPKKIDLRVAMRRKVFPEWLELVIAECKKGWYGLQGEECLFCEEEEPGAVCPGGERFIDLIYSEEEWWRTNDTTPSDRCHPKRQSREKCPVFLPCEPNRACTGNNTCAKEYSGFRCSDCADGYFRIGGLCQSCPDHAWLLAVMLGLGVVGVSVGGYIINSKGVRLAAFTIGVDYFQVLALFSRTRVRWPMVMERTLQALSFFNLNLELAAPSCWMSPPPTFEIKWMATMAVPLLAFGLLAVIYVTRYLYKLLVLRSPARLRHTHVNSIIATAVIIMYVLYIFLARRTLDIFNCAPTDPPDGNLYMSGRTDIICWESPVHVNLLVPLACITLLIYVSAFPIFAIILLRRNKERVKHDQILRAHGYGHTPLSNPNYSFRRRFQRLYHLFKPGKWYWILLILLRKFMIALTSLMFRSSPVYQLAVTLLVIFASFVLQVRHHPYMASKDFHEVVQHHLKRLTEGDELHKRIQKTIDDTKAKNIKQTTTGYGWEAQRQKMKDNRGQYLVSERIIGYLTDFNTVEAILLACAILVNLFGIMFLSSRFEGESMEYYRGDFETLGILAMLVVIVSCIYFVFVFSFEMLSTFHPNAALRAVSACSCGGNTVKASASEKGANVGPSSQQATLLSSRQSGFVNETNPLTAPEDTPQEETPEDCSPERVKQLESELEEARSELNSLKRSRSLAKNQASKNRYIPSRQRRQFGQTHANRATFGRGRGNKPASRQNLLQHGPTS